jgi:hypothetical protein
MIITGLNNENINFSSDIIVAKKQVLMDGYDSSCAGLGANSYWFGKSCLMGGDVIPLTEHYEADVQHAFGDIVTGEDGTRYLNDNGGTGINTPLHNGQGIKFNGEDQSIDTGVKITSDNFTLISSFSGAYGEEGSVSQYVGGDTTRLRYKLYSDKVQLQFGSYYLYGECNTELHNTYGIVCLDKMLSLYVNGILKDSVMLQLDSTAPADTNIIIGESSVYFEGIVNEVIVINKALTQSQIKAHFEYPEAFLYVDKELVGDEYHGVLKSKVLPQSVIDDIVAYYPMNEKIHSVRNMVGYVEEANGASSDGATPATSGDDNTCEVDTNVFTIHNESDTDETYHPYCRITNSNRVDGELFVIKITIEITSGTAHLNKVIGEYQLLGSDTTLDVGVYTYEFIDNYYESKEAIEVQFDGTVENTFDATVTYETIRKIPNISQVENFTDSCRDDAQNISYGRQNILDTFDGVNVSLVSDFKSYKFDGGRVMDLRLTDTELNSGDGFVIEFVLAREFTYDSRYFMWSKDGDYGLYMMLEKSWNKTQASLYLYDGDGDNTPVHFYIEDELPHHYSFHIKETDGFLKIDGEVDQTFDHSFAPSGLVFGDKVTSNVVGELNYFKLWYGDNYLNYNEEKSDTLGANAVKLLKGE